MGTWAGRSDDPDPGQQVVKLVVTGMTKSTLRMLKRPLVPTIISSPPGG
jgi:hypothetical protein